MNISVECTADGNSFVTTDGLRPRFTVISQQEAAQPESGQIPARAFKDKIVTISGEGALADDGWIYSSRVEEVRPS